MELLTGAVVMIERDNLLWGVREGGPKEFHLNVMNDEFLSCFIDASFGDFIDAGQWSLRAVFPSRAVINICQTK